MIDARGRARLTNWRIKVSRREGIYFFFFLALARASASRAACSARLRAASAACLAAVCFGVSFGAAAFLVAV